MSGILQPLTQNNQATFLYKKNFGVVDSTPNSNNLSTEAAGNARPFVFNSQIFTQEIPSSASLITLTSSFQYVYSDGSFGNNANDPLGNPAVGKVYTGTGQYTYMQYFYQLQLTELNAYTTFRFNNPANPLVVNLLNQAIPTNFDAGGSYGYKVNPSLNSGITILPGDDNYPYVIDTDAGYLYFTLGNWPTSSSSYGFPLLTFWRYNGTKLAGSNSLISTNTGIFNYVTGSTGSFQTISGNTGSFKSITGSIGSFQTISGNTGSFQSVTGSIGSFQTISGNTGLFQSVTGSAGSFQTILCNTGSFQSVTGGIGSFKTISGNTGSFQYVTGSTGSFQTILGNTGIFQYVTGSTGSFQSLLVNGVPVTGGGGGGTGTAYLSSTQTFTGVNTFSQDLSVNSIKVGRGGGNIASNTAVGYLTLNLNTGASNTALGYQALSNNTTGSTNTANGSNSLFYNISGTQNVAMGSGAGENIKGSYNTAIGYAALSGNGTTTSNNNTAIGYGGLLALTTGSSNTVLGMSAGSSTTTGSSNICIGTSSGQNMTGGSNNVYIGTTTVSSATVSNEVVIGNNITGSGANTVTIGTNSTPYVTISSSGLMGVKPVQTLIITTGMSGYISINGAGGWIPNYSYTDISFIRVRMCGGGGGAGGLGPIWSPLAGDYGGQAQFYIAGFGYGMFRTFGGAPGTGGYGNPPPAAGGGIGLGTDTTALSYVWGSNGGASSLFTGCYENAGGYGSNGGSCAYFGVPTNTMSFVSGARDGVGYGNGGSGAAGVAGQYSPAAGGGGGAFMELQGNVYKTPVMYYYLIATGGAGGVGTTGIRAKSGSPGIIMLELYS